MEFLTTKGRRIKVFVASSLSLLICLLATSPLLASYAAEKNLYDDRVLAQAEMGDAPLMRILAYEEFGKVSPENILYQEDFEDGDLAISDSKLVNGLTWTANGSLETGASSSYDSKIIKMNAGAYILSTQVMPQSEYTVAFTSINWYNTAARVMVSYQDESNYYSFSPTTGQVYRMLDGVEEELGTDDVRRLISSPRQNPSVNHYKIYFRNDGNSVTISTDRDGYDNRKDYEFTCIDKNPNAVKRFTGGRIKLARVDDGTSRYWVNFDNVLITKGKLQATLPGGPKNLYVSQAEGDDSFEGTESKPFKTISKALESSYPGDEIIVKDGVYDDQVKFLSNRIYGEEGKRLVIRARNSHKAAVTGANLKYGDFVTIEGFEVTGQSIIVGGSKDVEVLNNYIHDINRNSGITANGTNGRIANNYIYKTNKGIVVSGTNMLVENNEIERLIDSGADADYFRFFGEGHIIRGNYMHGTRHEETGSSHVDAFQTFDNNGEFARHIVIEGNFIEDFYHQGFMGEGKHHYYSYDIVFRNNVFKDAAAWGLDIVCLKDVKVYNNLFINMNTHGVGYRSSDEMPSTGEVRNNIFYNARNCYFGIDKNQYASNNLIFVPNPYQKYNLEDFPNDILNEDPLFTDIDNNDFSLHPNSPAIDSGTSLDFDRDFAGNTRPVGKGWDIGPSEFQGSDLPVAYIQYSNIVNKNTGYEPFKVSFDGTDSYAPGGKSIVSYEWDFGDGSIGEGPSANHTFKAGKHTVSLTVSDNTGKKHTATQELDVLPSAFPNLYLYLPFETNCLDASGKNMTVSSGEDTLFENSSYGRSIRFNNDKSRAISVSHSDYLDGLDEITIAFFVKKDSKDTAATVIHKHTVYTMDITASGFSGRIYTDAGLKTFKAANVVDDTGWHHYAITYNGSVIIGYLDGIECARVECSGKIARDASRAVAIGRNPWGDSIEGLMDEMRIYDRALSKDEIDKVIEGGLVDNPPQDRILTGIITPSAITGVANGTAKTASALGLPKYITLVTNNGNVQSSVVWDVGSCTYIQGSKESQSFTVNGTAALPAGVVNPNNIPLTVSISVTVKKAAGTQDPGDPKDPSDPGGSDTPDKPTKPSTPSTPTTPTPEPGDGNQDEDSYAVLEDEDLITKDYPEMVEQLERLYSSADIRDNKLNPTYGVMMKREPVISITPTCQNRLKQLTKLTFSDIKGTEWYASHIPMAVYRKVINGFPDGTFKGNNKVTRAEFLTMLARFNNSEGTIKQKSEQDAEGRAQMANLMGDSWYTNYIVVSQDGLIYVDQYTSETIVKPMTRGEVFYALANYLWKEDIHQSGKYHTIAANNEDPAFSDTLKAVTIANTDAGGSAAKSYQWYKQLMSATENPEAGVPMDFYPAIMCLKDKGILLGNNGESKWYDPISRAEALALFERLAKVWGEESK